MFSVCFIVTGKKLWFLELKIIVAFYGIEFCPYLLQDSVLIQAQARKTTSNPQFL